MQGRRKTFRLSHYMYYLNLLHEIITYAIGSLFIGIALAVLLTFALFWIIRACYPRSTFSMLSIITGIILVILLSYQMISMCGAIGMKWKCDDFEVYINNMIPEDELIYPRSLSKQETHQMMDQAIEEFPLIGYYVGWGDFWGYDTSNIAHVMADTVNDFLNQFIWEALLWSLIETLLAAIIVVWSIHKSKELKYSIKNGKAHLQTEKKSKPTGNGNKHSASSRHSTSSRGF